jgi:MASE11
MRFFTFRNNQNETIDEIRKQLLQKILIILNVLGIPVVIIGTIEALVLKQYYTAISYLLFFSPIIIVSIFRKKIAFKTIALIILGFAYILSISNIIIYGFGGAGIPILFTILLLATIFFNIRAGLYTVLLCTLAMIVIAYLYINNIISLGVSLDEISTNIISWFTAISVVALLGSLIVISFGVIQKKMLQSISFSKLQAEELKNMNSQLKEDMIKRKQTEKELRKTQDDLEKNIQKRTEEIKLKNDELLKRNHELEKYNNLFIDREYRIKDLKEIIQKLENE